MPLRSAFYKCSDKVNKFIPEEVQKTCVEKVINHIYDENINLSDDKSILNQLVVSDFQGNKREVVVGVFEEKGEDFCLILLREEAEDMPQFKYFLEVLDQSPGDL